MGSGGISPETSTTPPSPATRLPLEVIGTIVSYLIYDVRSLRTCTLTCYSWYIAAVPHLHHTLTIRINSYDQKFRWPNPIRHMHMLGLLPLVKNLRVCGDDYPKFSPKLFNCCIQRQFSALANVQELEIEYLDISSFMPRIKQYFSHFSSTVRSLILREPNGSCRQIIYFIGLFQHLQDLNLLYDRPSSREELADDLTHIPLFTPPLQGWLTMMCFTRVGLLKDMIDLFGGLRFHGMHLFDVDGMRLLLEACAKTLEAIVLYPTDPRGEQPCLKSTQVLAENFTVKFSLQDFDLSQNKSLHTVEFPASSIDCALNDNPPGSVLSFLKHLLSTIPPSVSLEIIVLYFDCDFCGVKSRWPYLREISQGEAAEEASWHRRRFEVLREVQKVQDFRLTLSATVSGRLGGILCEC